MLAFAPSSHTTHTYRRRRWGAVWAVLALCMQLWAGQVSAAHFGSALVDGLWRSDVCRSSASTTETHTLQALCITEHCPSCSAVGHTPFPAATPTPWQANAGTGEQALTAAHHPHNGSERLRPPAQAPPTGQLMALAAATLAAV